MVRVAAGQGGPIRWALDFQGGALDFLTTKNRNELVRESLDDAGTDWKKTFLPKRFSHYVERRPFPYPRHRLGFFLGKAKRMGLVKGIINRLSITKGWDPWSSNLPPLYLIVEWKKLNPGKYQRTNGLGSATALVSDMRRNAKRAVREVIDEMWGDGKFVPLIQSGRAMATALAGAKPRSTATANRQVLRVAIPFGHPVNSSVSATVKTAPEWEVNWIARKVAAHMAERLSGRGLSTDRRGVVTTGRPTNG